MGEDARDLLRGLGLVQEPRIDRDDPAQTRVSVDDRTVGYVDFDREFLVIRLDRVKALDQPLE
jgi:hypothetical protein